MYKPVWTCKRFFKSFFCQIVIVFAICPSFVQADPPTANLERSPDHPNSIADRDAVLLRDEIVPRDLPFFNPDIQNNLDLASSVQGLSAVFEGVLQKDWYSTRATTITCSDPETITLRGKKIGCQSKTKVIFLDSWWNPPNVKTDKAKSQLRQNRLDSVRHALCVGVVLSAEGLTETEDAYDCFKALTQVPSPAPERLKKIVAKMGFKVSQADSVIKEEVNTDSPMPCKGQSLSVSPEIRKLGQFSVDMTLLAEKVALSGSTESAGLDDFNKSHLSGNVYFDGEQADEIAYLLGQRQTSSPAVLLSDGMALLSCSQNEKGVWCSIGRNDGTQKSIYITDPKVLGLLVRLAPPPFVKNGDVVAPKMVYARCGKILASHYFCGVTLNPPSN